MMRRTPWTRLLLVAALATVPSYAVLRLAEGRGVTVLPPPLLAAGVLAVIALGVLVAGRAVRQYAEGRKPGLDPLAAARTVVLATASCYTGAVLSGWYAGHVLVVIGDLEIAARRDVATSAVLCLVAAVVLAVVGLVVERWCVVPPPDDEGPGLASGQRA